MRLITKQPFVEYQLMHKVNLALEPWARADTAGNVTRLSEGAKAQFAASGGTSQPALNQRTQAPAQPVAGKCDGFGIGQVRERMACEARITLGQ